MKMMGSVIIKKSFTFRFLYYWGKFVGLNTLTLLENNDLRFSYLSLIYACFLVIIYSYIYYCTLVERINLILPGEAPIGIIVHFIAMGSCYLETTTTWFIFGFYQNRVKLIVKSMMKIEKTSRKLDISTNYEKRLRMLGINVTVVIIAYIIYTAMGNIAKIYCPNFDVLIWTSWILPRITTVHTWIIFVWTLRTVEHKFRSLNNKVRFLMQDEYAQRWERNTAVSLKTLRVSSCNSDGILNRITSIFQLHRELRNVTSRIEEHLAVFFLMNIMTQFTTLTLSVFDNYSFLQSHSGTILNILYVMSNFCWGLLPAILLTIISNVCGSVIDEANKSGHILHSMINNCDYFGDTEEVAKLNVISLYLLQNKLRISVLGFFDLDGSLIYNIIAAATTYLTVMLQF